MEGTGEMGVAGEAEEAIDVEETGDMWCRIGELGEVIEVTGETGETGIAGEMVETIVRDMIIARRDGEAYACDNHYFKSRPFLL
jgi:hypothetical protein